MATISLPALALQPPAPQPSTADQIGKVIQLKSLINQQQLQQQQVQGATLENQVRQQALTDQKASTAALQSWDGKDLNELPDLILKHGGSANAVFSAKNQILEYQKNLTAMTKDQLANEKVKNDYMAQLIDNVKSMPEQLQAQGFEEAKQDAVSRGYLNPQQAQAMQYQGPDQLDLLEKSLMGHSAAVESAAKQATTRKDTAEAMKAEAEAQFYKNNPQLGAPGVPTEAVEMRDALANGKIKSPEEFPAFKAAQEARATQPYKIEQAVAEGKARQLVEGMEKPVYAIGKDGKRTLMSATDALQSGIRTMLPVTDKEVSDDIMLNNRLADVHQKITQYEQAMQNDLSFKDLGYLSHLMNNDLTIGVSGVKVPIEGLNRLRDAETQKNLSKEAQQRIIAYYNAREAMTGYNRVLTNSGRSSDKTLELQLDTLPNPLSAPSYASEAAKQFRQNLSVVGQGLPSIPGVKPPEAFDISAPVGKSSTQKKTDDPFAQFGGQSR